MSRRSVGESPARSVAGWCEAFDAVAVDSEHPLFVAYTSGTTGRPKGAVHVHGGFLAKIAEGRPEVPFDVLMDISQLRSETKRLVRDKLTGANDPAAKQMAAIQEQVQQLEIALKAATVRKTEAEAAKTEAAAAESQVDAAVKVATFTTPQDAAQPGAKPAASKTQVSVN